MAMQFPAGQRTPEKYPSTGPNYAKWGEQEHNGYVYDPATDKYYYDPKAKARWEVEAKKEIYGEEPEPPGIWETAGASTLPALATVAAMKGGEALPALLSGAGGSTTEAGLSYTAQALKDAGLLSLGGGESSAIATPEVLSIGGAAPIEAAASPFSLSGIGSAGNAYLPAAGLLGMAQLASIDRLNKDRKGAARGIGQGALSGAAMGSYFGPQGAAIGAGIGGLLGLAKMAMGHKSTKEYQQQRQNELLDRGVTGYSDFVNQLPKSAADDPNFGKVVSKNELKKEDVVGSNGVWDTYGNDWMGKFTTDQRWEIAQKLLDEGLFDTDHGDVVIYSENQDRARQIADEVLNPEKKEEEDKNAAL